MFSFLNRCVCLCKHFNQWFWLMVSLSLSKTNWPNILYIGKAFISAIMHRVDDKMRFEPCTVQTVDHGFKFAHIIWIINHFLTCGTPTFSHTCRSQLCSSAWKRQIVWKIGQADKLLSGLFGQSSLTRTLSFLFKNMFVYKFQGSLFGQTTMWKSILDARRERNVCKCFCILWLHCWYVFLFNEFVQLAWLWSISLCSISSTHSHSRKKIF